MPCPPNSDSSPNRSTCICRAGYASGPDGGLCVLCAAGTYKDMARLGPCVVCPAGTFKNVPGPGSCAACGSGSYSFANATTCVPCPANSGATPGQSGYCNCLAGYTWSAGLCVPCQAGTYKASQGSEPCVACPSGSISAAPASEACSECLAGSYAAAGDSRCTECPPQATTEVDAPVSIADCICRAGYEGDGWTCSACPAGTYKGKVGPGACMECPANSFSVGAGAGIHDCICSAGFTGSLQGLCVPCNSTTGVVCNRAMYGSCIASDMRALEVRGPSVAQAGIAFTAVVLKRDFYSQQIKSDSSSLLRVSDASSLSQNNESPSEIVGATLGTMRLGETRFSLGVRPAFHRADDGQTIELLSMPQLVFQGSDAHSKSGADMTSPTLRVNVSTGRAACPRGSVLSLGAASHTGAQIGSCTRCRAGTYSLDPLVGPASEPSCLACPAGGRCAGGDEVTFAVGDWAEEQGMFVLKSCPPGHELVGRSDQVDAAAQQCKPCLQTEYVMDPNRDSCTACPNGAVCDGSGLVARAEPAGAVWVADMEQRIYRLLSCPTGYRVVNSSADGVFAQQLQQCSACPEGRECTAASCQTCLPCAPGSFKDMAGPFPCTLCELGTYATAAGATSETFCRSCPLNSNTRNRGQVREC
eukprot:3936872-Rhodomonas_salina.10